jgi:hypothetical protein
MACAAPPPCCFFLIITLLLPSSVCARAADIRFEPLPHHLVRTVCFWRLSMLLLSTLHYLLGACPNSHSRCLAVRSLPARLIYLK